MTMMSTQMFLGGRHTNRSFSSRHFYKTEKSLNLHISLSANLKLYVCTMFLHTECEHLPISPIDTSTNMNENPYLLEWAAFLENFFHYHYHYHHHHHHHHHHRRRRRHHHHHHHYYYYHYYYYYYCVNNKMLESDWLLTAHIYYLILLIAAPKLSDLTCLVTKSL